MKRVVNIKNMLAAVAIFLVMFCAYTTGSVLDVLFDAKLKAAYLLLALLMMVTSAGIRISKVPLSAFALVCCLSVILLNKNANIVHGYFLSDFFLILFGLIMLFAVNTPRWHGAFIRLICIFGCIHAVVTLSQAIAPSIYRALILPLYAGSRYYTQVNYQLSNGFLPGLSFHYSTNGIYLATSLMLAAVLVICRRTPRRRNLILFLLIAAGLLLTGKRGVTVFSIAGFFMVYYIYKAYCQYSCAAYRAAGRARGHERRNAGDDRVYSALSGAVTFRRYQHGPVCPVCVGVSAISHKSAFRHRLGHIQVFPRA